MDLNWLGIALGFVAGMVVAFLWYSDWHFGSRWAKLTGIAPERSRAARTSNMVQLALANALTAVGLGCAIAATFWATDTRSVGLDVLVGAVAWLTLSMTTLLQHNAFELKPMALTVLNSEYQLTLFLAVALASGLVSA